MAEYFLIVILIAGQGSSMAAIPMQTLQACAKASVSAATLAGTFSTIKTACVKVDE